MAAKIDFLNILKASGAMPEGIKGEMAEAALRGAGKAFAGPLKRMFAPVLPLMGVAGVVLVGFALVALINVATVVAAVGGGVALVKILRGEKVELPEGLPIPKWLRLKAAPGDGDGTD